MGTMIKLTPFAIPSTHRLGAIARASQEIAQTQAEPIVNGPKVKRFCKGLVRKAPAMLPTPPLANSIPIASGVAFRCCASSMRSSVKPIDDRLSLGLGYLL